IAGTEQDVLLEAFDVDLEEVRLRNQALGKEGVEAADRHRTCLLVDRRFETVAPLRVHRAGGGICRIEIERPLLVRIAGRYVMVIWVRRGARQLSQLINGLFDGIEPMNDQMIAEPVPGWILAALNTDVEEHERLEQNARLHHPVGELGIGISK